MVELPGNVFVTNQVQKTTTASITNSSVLIAPANPNRRGFTIWNNSANSIYITFGPTSASASPTFILATFATLSFQPPNCWTGEISGIRNTGSGTVTIYEFLA